MMETIRRRLARLEAANADPMAIGDIRKATDEQLEAYIIAADIERRVTAGLPAVEYPERLSDEFLDAFIRTTEIKSSRKKVTKAVQ